jgi:hypothetical protein
MVPAAWRLGAHLRSPALTVNAWAEAPAARTISRPITASCGTPASARNGTFPALQLYLAERVLSDVAETQ